jgi:superfamily II DNA or RNA helicase
VSGVAIADRQSTAYTPTVRLFDYQAAIADMAIRKRKFAAFCECGLGKTLIATEFARHALGEMGGKSVLIVSPAMVVRQTIGEWVKFYGPTGAPRQIRAAQLAEWTQTTTGEIGITNYEALRSDVNIGNVGALILDESSMLKSHYGKWGAECIRLGRGLDWKLCLTGTPAPNDRIEYANHAVFLDHFPTVNSFLARFFVNRGQTQERWEIKKHALRPFYSALSHWCIFLSNPATYGWKDNCDTIPPIRVHIHDVTLTQQQRDMVYRDHGKLIVDQLGGITTRQKLARIAKGDGVESNKAGFIRDLIGTWPGESTLVWCIYNSEQDTIETALPTAGGIRGETDEDDRLDMIERFQRGDLRMLISKAKVLGFGLNLQIATRQVFSGLQDSYESYYQAVKRSNRVGSTKPLDVHIPITEIEAPMVDTVLRKAKRVEHDTREQEELFRAAF